MVKEVWISHTPLKQAREKLGSRDRTRDIANNVMDTAPCSVMQAPILGLVLRESGTHSSVTQVSYRAQIELGFMKVSKKASVWEISDAGSSDNISLAGELLVWNDQEQQIIPFHRIRQYVTCEGRPLGWARDVSVLDKTI